MTIDVCAQEYEEPQLAPDMGSLTRMVLLFAVPWALIIWVPLAWTGWRFNTPIDYLLHGVAVVAFPVIAAVLLGRWHHRLLDDAVAKTRVAPGGPQPWLFTRACLQTESSPAQRQLLDSGWLILRGQDVEVWSRASGRPAWTISPEDIVHIRPRAIWTGFTHEYVLTFHLTAERTIDLAIVRAGVGDLLGVGDSYIDQIIHSMQAA